MDEVELSALFSAPLILTLGGESGSVLLLWPGLENGVLMKSDDAGGPGGRCGVLGAGRRLC